MDSGTTILALAGLILVFWFTVLLPIGMARERGRSAFFWLLVSVVGSPFLAVFLLLVLGKVRGGRR